MRFNSNGPNIPDILLERRDQGRVVFLCGAGVSIDAGMPSFIDLTKHVMEFFDPPKGSELETSFSPWLHGVNQGTKVPLDQIFNLLYQEYGRDDVNTLVAKRLEAKGDQQEQSHHHKIISRISTDQNGTPQIVTTNFDLLFEQGFEDKPFPSYEPPALPDINLGMPVTGVTYLHGRLLNPEHRHHSYVLSSSDFGRAYLSEGWATNFIRSLLERYTVVLVGYQAEDPPIRYLLQGLNHDERSDHTNLYAFDIGLPEEVEAKWRDRGVTAIAYKDHPVLWDTLEGWSQRAEDPRLWRTQVVQLAMKGPRELSAHERGLVAHVVRSTPGARLFANKEQIPPAEWICVFDASCRVASPSSEYGENAEIFVPIEEYGLDDDPSTDEYTAEPTLREHDNLLEWRRGDSNSAFFHRLSGLQFHGLIDMPPRLFYLSTWLTNNLHSPVMAWWGLRQSGLHPKLVELIERKLRHDDELHDEARHTWRLIIEYQSDRRNFSWDGGWFDLKNRIKVEGWTHSTLRYFEEVTAPILKHKTIYGIGKSKPPQETWQEIEMGDITRWEVGFLDQHSEQIEIPDEILKLVFSIKERQLMRACGLLEDIKTKYFDCPSCYADREVDGPSDDPEEAFFNSFLKIFERLIINFPDTARAHALNWPLNDTYYFIKLKLFALNQAQLFSANEAFDTIIKMNQKLFWSIGSRRELLFLIHDRWQEFSKRKQSHLAERLLKGPDNYGGWSDSEFPKVRDEIACRYTQWLALKGCDLGTGHAKRLKKMITDLDSWSDGMAFSFVKVYRSRVRSIGIDDSPDTLINLPINKIVDQAISDYEHDFNRDTQKRSFSGLVKTNPRKALASLSYSARHEEYPITLWAELLREWPDYTNTRLVKVLLNRLCRLPEETIGELRNSVGWWIENKFYIVLQLDKDLAWHTFDYLVSAMSRHFANANKDSSNVKAEAGQAKIHSKRTYGLTYANPIGNSLQGLLYSLDRLKLKQTQGIPKEFSLRIEYFLKLPGEARDYSIAILSHDINWLHYLAPQWVSEELIAWFDYEHPYSEPAWNGFLSRAKIPTEAIGCKINHSLVKLFPRIYSWNWDKNLSKIATQIIIEISVFRKNESDAISDSDVRNSLRNMTVENRRDAIYRLSEIGKREENGWSIHVIPFISQIWPLERALRTSGLVSSWVSLLTYSEKDFPKVLAAVKMFLVPVEEEIHWLYPFTRQLRGHGPLTENHPESVLELLDSIVPKRSERLPFELAQILNIIEEVEPRLARDSRYLRMMDLLEQN